MNDGANDDCEGDLDDAMSASGLENTHVGLRTAPRPAWRHPPAGDVQQATDRELRARCGRPAHETVVIKRRNCGSAVMLEVSEFVQEQTTLGIIRNQRRESIDVNLACW